MGAPVNGRTYIFLDESGNFDFSSNGSRYFVLTGISMMRPFPVFGNLDDYKHDCIEGGMDIEYFHCYKDRPAVRNNVFDVIVESLNNLHIDCLVVEKRKAHPTMQEGNRLYFWTLGYLLKRMLIRELDAGMSEVIVITDTIPINKKRKAAEKAIRGAVVKSQLPGMKYRVLHHQSRSHYGLQAVDYCSWAIFRKWQKGESAWYDRIKPAIRSELDVFQTESKRYY